MAITRTIAKFTADVQQNCAMVASLAFTNSDGSPFDLTGITLSGQFRTTAEYSATPLAEATFTVATPASGIAIMGLSAHDAGLLPANSGKFSQFTNIVLEIDGTHASDPNNPFRLGEGEIRVSPGGNFAPSTATAPTTPLASISLVVGVVAVVPLATASASGAMSAVDRAAAAYFTTLVPASGTVPDVGSIVRTNGVSGQYVLAQGDTTANAAGLLGLYVGGVENVVPLTGVRTCLFNGTPTVGKPAFVSSTVEGKLTTVVSLLGIYPLGTVVTSASGSGLVYFGVAQSQPASFLDTMNAKFQAFSGVQAGKFVVTSDEFSGNALDTAKWGTTGTVATGAGGLLFTNNSSIYFNYSIDLVTPGSVSFLAHLGIKGIPSTGYLAWDIVSDSTRRLILSVNSVAGKVTLSQYPAATTVDIATGLSFTVRHDIDVFCDAAGNFYVSVDGGALSAPVVSSLITVTSALCQLSAFPTGGSIVLDNIYFGRVARGR